MPKGYLKKSEKDKLPDSIRVVQLQIESEIEISSTNSEEIKKQNALFICPDESTFERITSDLKPNLNVKCVDNPIDAMAVARINRPDILVYIEDVLNPSIWVTLRSFHQQENTPVIPALLYCPSLTGAEIRKAYQLGAISCCCNDLNATNISTQLNSVVTYVYQLIASSNPTSYIKISTENKEQSNARFVERLNLLIQKSITNKKFSINDMANQLGLSISTLERKCSILFHMPPKSYLAEVRLLKAYKLLESGEHSVSKVCELCGFSSSSYFSSKFLNRFKVKPSALVRELQRSA